MTTASGLMRPARVVRVSRTEFRQNQRETLNKAKGSTVVEITGDADEEKCVLDKKYFDEIIKRLKASVETLEVAMDKRLMTNIMSAAQTLNDDVREGKLLSMDEVFSED
jgi:hypothetical protein